MFTGIIEDIGKVTSLKKASQMLEASIETSLIQKLQLGDSIAINGVCSTVVSIHQNQFTVQYSFETLSHSTASTLSINQGVNLELSLTPTSRMGGHFVLGHVDEVGTIREINVQKEFGKLVIEYSPKYQKFLIPKGSITIDGISLTLGEITETTLSSYIVPHTYQNTTLCHKKQLDKVNLEYDLLGKYIYQFQIAKKEPQNNDQNLLDHLKSAGYL